jgi:hypothetical protein
LGTAERIFAVIPDLAIAPSSSAPPSLRAVLVDMRSQLVEQLAEGIDGGVLALLGTVHTAIAALEASEQIAANGAARDGRIVVSDDGTSLKVTVYRAKGLQATVELTAGQAAHLAASLASAAARRI